MITRLVKLHFQPEKIEDFLSFFDTVNQVVNTFPGCQGMRLTQDILRPEIVFTISNWESEEALNNYRDSEAFGKIWKTIKPMFLEKPEAWSVGDYFDGFGLDSRP